jgi:hypothetical protein
MLHVNMLCCVWIRIVDPNRMNPNRNSRFLDQKVEDKYSVEKKMYLKIIIYSYFSTGTIQKLYFYTVFRICRIRKFLDLMDLDSDPLVRGMDPDPDPAINKQK